MFHLGVVPYLNAVPLIGALDARVRLLEDLPANLSRLLEQGRVDAALLPVAEAMRGVGAGYLGRYGITSNGAVASVLLFLRSPLHEVRTVLLDPASRTSAALAQHVVREAAGPGVTFHTGGQPGPNPGESEEDAILVIGDPALRHRPSWPLEVLDLGEVWTQRTGLPFVYARWTARLGLDSRDRRRLAALLDAAAAQGVTRRRELARAWADAHGEDVEAAERYVREHVGYEIGQREEEGLARYAAILNGHAAPGVPETRHA